MVINFMYFSILIFSRSYTEGLNTDRHVGLYTFVIMAI